MGIHPGSAPGYKPPADAGMNADDIYAGVDSGELQVLYVLGADPVGDGQMSGRGKLDFLVVQDLFLTESAAAADIVLPALSWVERDGTYTNGERRVQRSYPAIQPLANCKPDWQILALLGERVGLDKPPFAASLIFREIAQEVPQYKGMDYRSLAQVQKQWPDVGGDDLYYGGNAYENQAGLGQQWKVAASALDEPLGISDYVTEEQPGGLQGIRIAALFTPGTLNSHSALIQSRLAQPELLVHAADADRLDLLEDVRVKVQMHGHVHEARVVVSDKTKAGLVLLRGVPFIPGMHDVQVNKIEEREKEFVA